MTLYKWDSGASMSVIKNKNIGTTAIEYALVLTLISMIAIAAAKTMGADLSGFYVVLASTVEESGSQQSNNNITES